MSIVHCDSITIGDWLIKKIKIRSLKNFFSSASIFSEIVTLKDRKTKSNFEKLNQTNLNLTN